MPTVNETIEILSSAERTFAVTNDFALWPSVMREYRSVEVKRTQGRKRFFEINHVSGQKWLSWRVLEPGVPFAYAERFRPRGPFEFMHILWTYRLVEDNRCLMTWNMEFELIDSLKSQRDEFSLRFQTHTRDNQRRWKAFVEGGEMS